jgi:fructose-bisphosphate aldolase class I
LRQKNIVPGIKVDKGIQILPASPEESFTVGLEGLANRLVEYQKLGARFAKWRSVLSVSECYPSLLAMETNAEGLALYASTCQAQGIVPIVEPELLMDGSHTFERCFEATQATLQVVFAALHRHRVSLEHMILKPSMVIAGKNCPQQASIEEAVDLKAEMKPVPGTQLDSKEVFVYNDNLVVVS